MTGPDLNFPDPRPAIDVDGHGTARIAGWRCSNCQLQVALPGPSCPNCRGEFRPAFFGPDGVVWSSTVVRIPINDRTEPFALVYVDIDDGPRVLGHLVGDHHDVIHVGEKVHLQGLTARGDLAFDVSGRPR